MQFSELSLDSIEPSLCNPRRQRNKVVDADLVASISTYGIVTPLLVRPLSESGKYQIAAGHRRYEAAKKLNLATVPVQIREMDDKEYLEILHVENLQHEDIHPLDEAVGFKQLLEQGGYDITTLACKLAKSEGYVYARLKLNDLTKEAQKLYLEAKIGFGQAVILARLDKKQQKDIVANHLFTYQEEAVSVRQLSDYVRRFLYLDLGNVPWSLEDVGLVPEAGGCSGCPKRTGSNPSLFSDMQSNTCTDRICFEKKMQAHIQKQIDSKPEMLKFSDYSTKKDASIVTSATSRRLWGKEDKCESAEEVVLMDGSDRGRTTFVCRDRECPQHSMYRRNGETTENSDAANRKKQRIEKVFRERLFREISAKVKSLLGDKATRIVARAMWRRLYNDSKRVLLKALGREVPRESIQEFGEQIVMKANPVDLGRFMACMAVAEELMVPSYQAGKPETMLALADIYNIDVNAMRGGIKTEARAGTAKRRKDAANDTAKKRNLKSLKRKAN
jgi:ParB family chromosome partitioning protein